MDGDNVGSSLECFIPFSFPHDMTWSATACFDAYFWYPSLIRKIAKGGLHPLVLVVRLLVRFLAYVPGSNYLSVCEIIVTLR